MSVVFTVFFSSAATERNSLIAPLPTVGLSLGISRWSFFLKSFDNEPGFSISAFSCYNPSC